MPIVDLFPSWVRKDGLMILFILFCSLAVVQNALKVRKGDFDHIVDDVSDGEGDEAAGALARAEMELREDRARDRAIITAVTEGHDAMRKMQKKGKYTFDKLVGDGREKSRRGEGQDGAAEEVQEEEFDEEEMLQRGMKDRFDREYQSRARRGRNADSDSDSAEGSDTEEDLLQQLGTFAFCQRHNDFLLDKNSSVDS
jgi:hypothetical protein